MSKRRRETNMEPVFRRNRSPCQQCQRAKRKCDQTKPRCGRCCRLSLACAPSVQGRWRIATGQLSAQTSSAPDATLRHANKSTSATVAAGDDETISCQHLSAVSPHASPGSNIALLQGEDAVTSGTDSAAPASAPVSPQPCCNGLEPVAAPTEVLPPHALRLLSDCSESLQSPAEHLPSDDASDASTQHTWRSHRTYDVDSIVDMANILDPIAMESSEFSEVVGTSHLAASHIPRATPGSEARPDSNHAQCLSLSTDAVDVDISADSDAIIGGIRLMLTCSSQPPAEATIPHHASYFYKLWQFFHSNIASYLTPLGAHSENPFLKYLLQQAKDNSNTMIAVLYLSSLIYKRTEPKLTNPLWQSSNALLHSIALNALQQLEHDFDRLHDLPTNSADHSMHAMRTFTTIVVFCMAFVASQNAELLLYWMEYGTILSQVLFKTRAGDESFLYLANMLGFTQTLLLFSTHAHDMNAWDLMGAALESHKIHHHHTDLLCSIDGWQPEHNHFQDLDMFSGMSVSLASLLHTLGMLLKKKKGCRIADSIAQSQWVRIYQSEVDGLESRLHRHLALISKRSRESVFRTNNSASLTECLNWYNEALFWCAWTFFWDDLQDQQTGESNDNTEVRAERILDACAKVPKSSTTAPLLLFPLMVGGLRATKAVYREFVIGRLEDQNNLGLTDTKCLCAELKRAWSSADFLQENSRYTNLLII